MPSFFRFGTDLSEQRHEVICHYNKIPTSLCCQDVFCDKIIWKYHSNGTVVAVGWYRYQISATHAVKGRRGECATRSHELAWFPPTRFEFHNLHFVYFWLCCQWLLFDNNYFSNNMLFFTENLHESCYNIYKYSSLILPAIIFAD